MSEARIGKRKASNAEGSAKRICSLILFKIIVTSWLISKVSQRASNLTRSLPVTIVGRGSRNIGSLSFGRFDTSWLVGIWKVSINCLTISRDKVRAISSPRFPSLLVSTMAFRKATTELTFDVFFCMGGRMIWRVYSSSNSANNVFRVDRSDL